MISFVSKWAALAAFVGCTALSGVALAQSANPNAQSAEVAKVQAEAAAAQAARAISQPGNNQPVWSSVRDGASNAYTSIQGRETNVLIQSDGQRWRAIRNGQVAVYGGWALVLILALIAGFYAWRGTWKLHAKPTGNLIERFTKLERYSHWTTAISFCILAASGLILAFGKTLLIPIVGYWVFGVLAAVAKSAHNFIGPLFAVSIVLTFIIFVRSNFPSASDAKWLAKGGGLVSQEHVPSGRFNAGEKLWFWGGLFTLGITTAVTGLILDFPNFDQTRSIMQQANIIHFIAALLFMAGFLGHVYMGTVGVEGAYGAMRTGYVDEAWAKEHHSEWAEDVRTGKIPAQRTPTPRATAQAAD